MFLYGRDSIRNFLWKVFGGCCLDKDVIVFKESMLIADPAPDPENIEWEYLNVGFCSKFLRRLISVAITIVLVFCTLLFLAYLSN